MLQIVEKKYDDSPNSGHVYYLASNYNLGIKNYSKALTYAEKCLRIRNQIKDKIDLMLIQVLICEIYLKLENYEKMKSYADLCQLMLKYYNNKNDFNFNTIDKNGCSNNIKKAFTTPTQLAATTTTTKKRLQQLQQQQPASTMQI